MKIIDVVDSLEYSSTNCYQHQLQKMLQQVPGIITVPLADLHRHERPDLVLSRLKQRTLHRIMNDFGRWAGDTPVYVYDQDPWHAFLDDSPYRGVYHDLAKVVNVKSYLVTSKWWSDLINSKGLPSKFVTMWMLPEYCTSDPHWDTRKVEVGFCGQLHPYRRELFERLQKEGIAVHHWPSGDYQHYLNCLSQTKIFVHSEQVNWSIDGVKLAGPNALWIKDIEAAARGCISMRENEPEGMFYGVGEIGTIRPFTPGEIDELVCSIKIYGSDPHMLLSSFDTPIRIRQNRGWRTVIDAMEVT